MEHGFRKIRVFVASPSDVQAERGQLVKVIDELNVTIAAIAPEKRIVLELVRWETHVAPSLGADAQAVVTRQIGEFEVFVGILWKRMGTPTSVATSGTEEEFLQAHARWERDRSFPVLLYFCQQPFPPPRTSEEVEQLAKVVDFRNRVSAIGLVADYPDHGQFADIIRPHLLLVIGRLCAPGQAPADMARQLTEQQESVDGSGIRQQIAAFAQEYEHVRATMDPGDERTRRMEDVASRMRAVALGGQALVPELAASSSAGNRLAAVVMLEAVPRVELLPWLAQRLGSEKPFVGYHAAMALLHAVRALRTTHPQELRAAVNTAKEQFLTNFHGSHSASTDRYQILLQAETELETPVSHVTVSSDAPSRAVGRR